MVTGVIGRDEELTSIEAFFDRIEGGPGVLVLSGKPGIGKTILWEVAVEEARNRFGRVMTCRGVEAEASFAFASLSDLLGGFIREVAPGLAPPRRHALEVALQLAEPGDVTPDVHVIGLALLDVLQALGERGPLLVAIDDAQWLDPASAGVLQVALRRLREEPVGLLATLRAGTDVAGTFELDRSLPEQRVDRLLLGPLTLGAIYALLRERVGLELSRPELVRMQEATAGNPFFALELGRELARTNARVAPSHPLRVPDSLHELLGGRLARLPDDTRDGLIHAAALARPTIELLVSACGQEVLDALETAVRDGVIHLDDSRIRFTHPLLASICYEQASLRKRRAVHKALAGVVSDAEERARHLALGADGPSATIASELDTAAELAAARGAPTAAAALCELASERTSTDPEAAQRRRLHAARFHTLAGDPDRAVTLLDSLLGEVEAGPKRADALLARISTLKGDTPQLLALCDEALVDAAGDDVLSARILALRIWFHLLETDMPASLRDARAALEKAERTGDPALLAFVIARVAQVEMWTAEITPGLLERGAEIEDRLGLELGYRDSPRLHLARLLIRMGEVDRARAMVEELEIRANGRGDEMTRMVTLWYLGTLEWLAGQWQRALEHATVAHELAEQIQSRQWIGRVKALVEADLGLVEEARASAEEGLAHARAFSVGVHEIMCLGMLGRVELALGHLEPAGDYLRDLPEKLLAGGMSDPTVPLWPDAIETLISLGDVEQARAYLESFELNAERLGSPVATAGATRCRGLLAAAEGDTDAALAAFEKSLVDAAPFPLERGRTLFCLGMVRRQAQQKKAAREALEQALAIFEQLPAPLWAEKARSELKRISGRRAPSEVLTETERRVAELAAQGRTNKEIAAELFMGVSTVEAHLSHVYRKLGVRRTELGSSLAKEREEAAQP